MIAGTLLGTLLALCVGLALSAVSWAASPAGTVSVSGQIQPRQLPIRPHGYYHSTSLFGLQWSSWGRATATARGTFTFQFCVEESCSVSPVFVDPAAVALSGMKRCRGRLSYTELALHVEGLLPDASFDRFRAKVGACRG